MPRRSAITFPDLLYGIMDRLRRSPGENERQLLEYFGVGSGTIRRALQVLKDDGLVHSVPGTHGAKRHYRKDFGFRFDEFTLQEFYPDHYHLLKYIERNPGETWSEIMNELQNVANFRWSPNTTKARLAALRKWGFVQKRSRTRLADVEDLRSTPKFQSANEGYYYVDRTGASRPYIPHMSAADRKRQAEAQTLRNLHRK